MHSDPEPGLTYDGKHCPRCGQEALDLRGCGFNGEALEAQGKCYVFLMAHGSDQELFRCLTRKG